jgi:hypothetical protein
MPFAGVTEASDYVFEPKVWSDHIQAYFDRMLVFGAFALRNDQLKAEGSGLTVNFPYFKAIGAAEEPAENAALTVDNMSDDSFSATVFEVGKAVGFTKKSFKKSAASMDQIMAEAQRQIARVHAEKVDQKLLAEIDNPLNHTNGYTATLATDTMNVRTLLRGKVAAFGDKHKDSVVCFMHSLQSLSLMTDPTSGFLKADANDPMYLVDGFEGRLLGMAIVSVDTMTQVADIASTDAYRALICKENAYGIMRKQEMEMDSDKDILARQIIVTGNEWYAVKSFHAKISPADKKIASVITTV